MIKMPLNDFILFLFLKVCTSVTNTVRNSRLDQVSY